VKHVGDVLWFDRAARVDAQGNRLPRSRVAMLVLTLVLLAGSPGCSSKPGISTKILFSNMPSAVVALSFNQTTHLIGLRFGAYGLVPGGVYQLQLHHGTCLTPTVRPLVTFDTASADSAGSASAEVKANASSPSGIPKGIYVDMHLLDAQGNSEALSSACADIPTRSPTDALRLFAPPGRKAFGTVTARYRDRRTLELRFRLMGLAPGSTHAMHVARGTCAAEGGIVHSLGDVVADSIGSASATKIVQLPAKSERFSVQIFAGPSALIGTSKPDPGDAQPILCADLPPD